MSEFHLRFICQNPKQHQWKRIKSSISSLKPLLTDEEKENLHLYIQDDKNISKDFYDLVLYPGEKVHRKSKEQSSFIFYKTQSNPNLRYIKRTKRGKGNYVIEMSSLTPDWKIATLLLTDIKDDEMLSNIKKELITLLKKYPTSYEILHRLASLELSKNKHQETYNYLKQAEQFQGKEHPDIGIIERWHIHSLEMMMGIVCYYIKQYEDGMKYLDRLLLNKSQQQHMQNLYSNYEFYIQPIPTLFSKKYPCSSLTTLEKNIQNYTSLNPSIHEYQTIKDKTFFINLRIVNWKVNPIGFNQYTSPHPKGKFKTKNLLGIINQQGEWIMEPRLIRMASTLKLNKIRNSHIDGFEDVRLFQYDPAQQKISFITNYSKNNPSGATRLSIGKIDVSDLENPKYCELYPIQGHGQHQTQKNWLVYDTFILCNGEGTSSSSNYSEERIRSVYGYQPFQCVEIQKYYPTHNAYAKVIHEDISDKFHLGNWRGSAGPVPFEDGYVLIIHEVYLKSHGGRRYLHRFVYLDNSLHIVGCSHLWYIESKDIEYVSTLQKCDDMYLMGYGVSDSCACVSAISHQTIKEYKRLW